MLEFDYQALNSEQQPTSGRIAAESAAVAIAELENQGLAVQSVRQVEIAEPAGTTLTPVSADDCEKVLLERVDQLVELREVLAPGLTAFAAEMPAGHSRRELRKLAAQLTDGASAEQIIRGTNLSVLLPLIGDNAMLGSHRSLGGLFAESAYRNRARTARVRSMLYPLIVFIVALVVLMFLGLAVVPTFADIFDDFDMDLPGLTQGLVHFSNELRFHPLRLFSLISGVIAVVYAAFYVLKNWGFPGRLLSDFTSGNSSQIAALAIFTRTLAEALEAGFSLACAMRLAGMSSNLRWLRREADALAEASEGEHSIPEQVVSEARLPTTIAHALRAGPFYAPSLPLLRELAELYTERVRNRLDWSTGFMPQFTILFVGVVVGGVVLALFLPLVSLINGLTG